MKPLIVKYSHQQLFRSPPKTLIITNVSAELFEPWRQLMEKESEVYEVILCGPAVATGWRIYLERPVSFVERPTIDEHDAIAQRQAAVRIVNRNFFDPQVYSPFNLIQEHVSKDRFYMWRVLVACILLNRTNGRQVRPIVDELFKRCPSPAAMIAADLTDVLRPLGLQKTRSKRLKDLSAEFVLRRKEHQFWAKLPGIGQYALDSVDIFCFGMTDFEPTDQWLGPYLQWRRAGGPQVLWDERGFSDWRQS